MGIMNWLYDHAPAPVQQWMERREMDRMADTQYEQWHHRLEQRIEELAKAESADLTNGRDWIEAKLDGAHYRPARDMEHER